MKTRSLGRIIAETTEFLNEDGAVCRCLTDEHEDNVDIDEGNSLLGSSRRPACHTSSAVQRKVDRWAVNLATINYFRSTLAISPIYIR